MTRELASGPSGSVTLTESALGRIVAHAVAQVDGARLLRGRRRPAVEIDAGRARAQLELAVGYGRVLPEVARAVQAQVADALAGMCGLAVDAVDVTVEELDR